MKQLHKLFSLPLPSLPVNQPYGKHVVGQECLKRKLDKFAPAVEDFSMLWVTIHPGQKGSDSTIAQNKVPSLRMLCRGVQAEKALIKMEDLPPITIKEALEINYSLQRSDKTLERECRWRYLTERLILPCVGNSVSFTNSCLSLLKAVDHFEGKIRGARIARSNGKMRLWNAKLNQLLRIPFHDHFNAFTATKFRVYEYPAKTGGIATLCFSCPEPDCKGCFVSKAATPAPVKRGPGRPRTRSTPPAKVRAVNSEGRKRGPGRPRRDDSAPRAGRGRGPGRPSGRPSGRGPGRPPRSSYENYDPPQRVVGSQGKSKAQMIYYKHLKVWKTPMELKADRAKLGKYLGYKHPASLEELVKYRKKRARMIEMRRQQEGGGRAGQPGMPPRRTIQQQQRLFKHHFNVYKSKEELQAIYAKAGDLLGYKRPATLSEAIRYEQQHPGSLTSISIQSRPEDDKNEAQRLFHQHFNVWKTKSDLRTIFAKAGELLNLDGPATLMETIQYEKDNPGSLSNMKAPSALSVLRKCPACDGTFADSESYDAHRNVCGKPAGAEGDDAEDAGQGASGPTLHMEAVTEEAEAPAAQWENGSNSTTDDSSRPSTAAAGGQPDMDVILPD